MGMLIDFYTGDTKRIIKALKADDLDKIASGGIVTASADFSFHLSTDDLDQLVRAACALLDLPSMTFAQSVRSDIIASPAGDPEMGVHEMSDAFRDLFAALSPDQSLMLYETWTAQMPEPPKNPRPGIARRFMQKMQRGIGLAAFAVVLAPLFAVYWLASPRFRKERRQNKLKKAATEQKPASTDEYTLKEAIDALVNTCRTAKAQGKSVIYAWSL